MRVITDLDLSEREILKERHKTHHLFSSQIKPILDKPHCFRANIFSSDYEVILIHSCLATTQDPRYQPISEAIAHIKTNQDFLNSSASGCLDDRTVRCYLNKLNTCGDKLQDCFLKMNDCFMINRSELANTMRYEITDGMHRLVAYGLATDLNEIHFPIPIYFGTDQAFQIAQEGI